MLDDQFKLVPGGSWGRSIAYRDWFMANVLPQLPLAKQPVNTRGHLYLNLDQPYLFSYMRRESGGRTFYVVIEDDLFHLVGHLFPQFFIFNEASKRLYQVVDDRGEVRYGAPFGEISDGLVVERRFTETWDGFALRVAQKDLGDPAAARRKRLINSVLIGAAVLVILGGLLVLGFALRRERRLNELTSEIISTVSHELKTPPSIISMSAICSRRRTMPEPGRVRRIIWRSRCCGCPIETSSLSRRRRNLAGRLRVRRRHGAPRGRGSSRSSRAPRAGLRDDSSSRDPASCRTFASTPTVPLAG